MNLGEEVILTLFWQSSTSESATARMFCYWLKYLQLTVARVCACVCVCARVCERDRVPSQHISYLMDDYTYFLVVDNRLEQLLMHSG